jgi:septum site-determining protein MinC
VCSSDLHSNELTIKGTRHGLIINLPDDGELPEVMEQLRLRLTSSAAFFRGGRVALHVGWRTLETADIERIGTVLSEHGVSLWSVLSEAESTQRAARSLGLEVEMSNAEVQRSAAVVRPVEAPEPVHTNKSSSAVFVQRTLRSGQRIQYAGHVVVIGDVNPGAEIIAGGHVVVWGRLRGTVHAGADGDDSAVVCALALFPTQLRIGNHIARSPESRPSRVKMPEMASVQDGEIIAEPWISG